MRTPAGGDATTISISRAGSCTDRSSISAVGRRRFTELLSESPARSAPHQWPDDEATHPIVSRSATHRRTPSVRSCVCSAAASDLTKPTRYGYRQQTHSDSRSQFQATGQHRGRGELDRHPSVGSLPPGAPPVPEVFRHQLDALEPAAELDAPLWLKPRPRPRARCMASCSLQSP